MFEHIKVRLGLTILTKESAIQYAKAHLDHYPTLAIISAKHTTELGVPAIDVIFEIDDYITENTIGRCQHTFTVWIENEKLYGEW